MFGWSGSLPEILRDCTVLVYKPLSQYQVWILANKVYDKTWCVHFMLAQKLVK